MTDRFLLCIRLSDFVLSLSRFYQRCHREDRQATTNQLGDVKRDDVKEELNKLECAEDGSAKPQTKYTTEIDHYLSDLTDDNKQSNELTGINALEI